jgi:hypothetical protein
VPGGRPRAFSTGEPAILRLDQRVRSLVGVKDVQDAVALLARTPFLALTGAGMSTDSGIPDYRGPTSVARTPMTYAEFVSGPRARQHYWARSYTGWSRMRGASRTPVTSHWPASSRAGCAAGSSPRTSTACTSAPAHPASWRCTAGWPR